MPSICIAGTMQSNGNQKTVRLRVVDWEHPANNDVLLVSQFSVTGAIILSVPSSFDLILI